MPTFIQGTAIQWNRIVTGLNGTDRISLDVAERFRFPDSIELRVDHRCHLRCGKAKVWTDNTGLRFELEVNSREAWRAVSDIRAGRLKGCSVSMLTNGRQVTESGRTFVDTTEILELLEVSVCETPGDPTALVQVSDRSIVPADRNGLFNNWRSRRNRQLTSRRRQKAGKRNALRDIGPMPEAGLRGMAILNAALSGKSTMVCGIQLSADSCRKLLGSMFKKRGPMAIR